jgi:hypothetical protein
MFAGSVPTLGRLPGHGAQGDVDEALRLMRQSKSSLENSGPGNGAGDGAYEDAVSLVYRLVREYSSRTGELEVPYAKIQELTQRHNISVRNRHHRVPLRVLWSHT